MFETVLIKFLIKSEKEKLLKSYEETLDMYELIMNRTEKSKDRFYMSNYDTRKSIYNGIDKIEKIIKDTYKRYKKYGGKRYFVLRERTPFLKDNEFIHECSRCKKKHIYTKEDIRHGRIKKCYVINKLFSCSEPHEIEEEVEVLICPTCGKNNII